MSTTIEHATVSKSRSIPAWLLRQLDAERIEARAIADPVKRRLREIEIDGKQTEIELSLWQGGGDDVQHRKA